MDFAIVALWIQNIRTQPCHIKWRGMKGIIHRQNQLQIISNTLATTHSHQLHSLIDNIIIMNTNTTKSLRKVASLNNLTGLFRPPLSPTAQALWSQVEAEVRNPALYTPEQDPWRLRERWRRHPSLSKKQAFKDAFMGIELGAGAFLVYLIGDYFFDFHAGDGHGHH